MHRAFFIFVSRAHAETNIILAFFWALVNALFYIEASILLHVMILDCVQPNIKLTLLCVHSHLSPLVSTGELDTLTRMSVARALAWNTGVQVAGKVVSTGIGIAIIGIMTRLLGQQGFGAYSTANAFLQIFALLLDLGLNVTQVALLGEHAGDKKYEDRCTSALFTLRIIMSLLVLCVIAPIVAFLFPYPLELKLAIIALTGSFVFPSLNQIVIGAEQRHLKMHVAAIAENIGRVIALIGLILAGFYGWSLVPMMWIITLASLGNFIVNILYARTFASFRWNWDPEFWKSTLKRSWPVGLSIAFVLLYFKADTLILSLARDQAEVGIYGAAYRVLEILITIPFMYAGLLLPILSNAWAKKDNERFKKMMSASIDVMLLMIIPIIVGTWLLGTDLMVIVAGEDFRSAGPVLSILILGVGAIYLNTIFSHAIIALDAQRKMIPIYATVAILSLSGYILLIPEYGILAAAWITVAAETAVGFGSFIFTYRKAPLAFSPRALLAALTASAVMALAVFYLRNFPLFVSISAAAVVYSLATLALGGVPMATIREILARKKDQPPLPPIVG